MTAALARPSGFAGAWFGDADTRAAYSEGAGPYRIIPRAVAVPENLDDLGTLVQCAAAEGLSLTPRGAGSGMPGGNVGPGVVVDLGRFSRPLRISADGIANAPAAVTLREINDAARHLQLRLTPDPASADFCTIGGMVATNAAGPNALQYGSIREWVRGVELVTADGETCWLGRKDTERPVRRPGTGQHPTIETDAAAVRRFWSDALPALQAAEDLIAQSVPQTTKNSAGYACHEFLQSKDLVDLIIGSEGTLGFITRVEATLDTVPSAVGTVVLGLADLAELQDVVTTLRSLRPSAIEWLDRTFLDLTGVELPGAADGIIIAEFERQQSSGMRGVIGDAVRQTTDACRFARTALDPAARRTLWNMRKGASDALARLPSNMRSLQIIEDGCVPPHHLGAYVEAVGRASNETGIPVVMFGHAGDGHVHVNALIDADDASMIDRLRTLNDLVMDELRMLGGTPSGEHGDGRLRASCTQQFLGADVTTVLGQIKKAFDPQGIMNPGVILAPAEPFAQHLKVGPNAAPIPDYIEKQLRDIEHRRGWATPKHRLVR